MTLKKYYSQTYIRTVIPNLRIQVQLYTGQVEAMILLA